MPPAGGLAQVWFGWSREVHGSGGQVGPKYAALTWIALNFDAAVQRSVTRLTMGKPRPRP